MLLHKNFVPGKNFSYIGKRSLTYWLKKLDPYIGKNLITLFPSKNVKSNKDFKYLYKILIIRPGGIGDAVLLIPSLQVFHQIFPNCKIYILAEKRNMGVFSPLSYIKKIFIYNKVSDLIKVLFMSYDAVIDTEQWHYLSAFWTSRLKAPIKVGFATNERKEVFNYPVEYFQEDYELESFFRLFYPLIGPRYWDYERPFIPLPRRFFYTLDAAYPWIGIFPGASIKERQWPLERFKELAYWLHKKGFRLLVVGGKQEAQIGEYILEDLPFSINMAGRTSLYETAQLLRQVLLLITSDSGVMHLSIGVGTPVVALFGPGIEGKWAPRDKKSVVINKRLPCSPCTLFGYTPPCSYQARCMKEISVAEVKEAIYEVLDKIASN